MNKKKLKQKQLLQKPKKNLAFMETSAKDNNNVEKDFLTLLKEIMKIYKEKN